MLRLKSKGEKIMKVLLVVPAYNEEDNIVRVCTQLRENYPQYDFVVVMMDQVIRH